MDITKQSHPKLRGEAVGAWDEGSFVAFRKHQETADIRLVAASRRLPLHCRGLPAAGAAACRRAAAACRRTAASTAVLLSFA